MIPLSTPPGTKIVCIKPHGLYAMEDGSTFRLVEGGEYTLVEFVNDADTGGADADLWFVVLAEIDPVNVFRRSTFRLRALPTVLADCLTAQPLLSDRDVVEALWLDRDALVGLWRSGVA